MASVSPGFHFILSSDGSGKPGESGGGACIVECVQDALPDQSLKKRKCVGYFGSSTGNQAELMAALLGFCILKSMLNQANQQVGRLPKILWQTDSQYLIRTFSQLRDGGGKTENMPNLGLWNAIFHFADGLSIEPVHVRARSGNRRNEACDHASRWVQRSGEKLLNKFGEQKIGRLRQSAPDEAWQIYDLRELLEAFQGESTQNTEQSFENLQKRIAETPFQTS